MCLSAASFSFYEDVEDFEVGGNVEIQLGFVENITSGEMLPFKEALLRSIRLLNRADAT